ncbi:MAG: hypothetical protein ACQR30_08340, partial [Arachidicoccus sp.]
RTLRPRVLPLPSTLCAASFFFVLLAFTSLNISSSRNWTDSFDRVAVGFHRSIVAVNSTTQSSNQFLLR